MTQYSTDLEAEFSENVLFDGVVAAPAGSSLASTMITTSVPAVSAAAVVNGEVAWARVWG